MKNYFIATPQDRDKFMNRSLIVANNHNMQQTQKPNSPYKNQIFYQPHLANRLNVSQNNAQNSQGNYLFKLSSTKIDTPQRDQYQKRSRISQSVPQRSRTYHDLEQKIEQITKKLQKQEIKLTNLQQSIGTKINHFGNTMADKIIQETFNALKNPKIMKQILAASNFNHSMNAQVYQHLFNFKMDLQTIKDEIHKCIKITHFDTEIDKIEQKWKQNFEQNELERKKQLDDLEAYLNMNFDISVKRAEEQLEKHINSKVGQAKNYLEQNLLKFQQSKLEKMNPQLQISKLKYQQTPLLIKYQQILKTQAKEMNLSQYTYFIDSQGFLLDQNSFYIINKVGQKILLEESHRQLLKKHNVIN